MMEGKEKKKELEKNWIRDVQLITYLESYHSCSPRSLA